MVDFLKEKPQLYHCRSLSQKDTMAQSLASYKTQALSSNSATFAWAAHDGPPPSNAIIDSW